MLLEDIFHAAVQSYLEETYEYDFIHEVIGVNAVSEDGGELLAEVEYRGVDGEYGTLRIDEQIEDFIEKLST